ncbi:MAG: hypothetical protein ACSLEN_07990 [Candidatus Malihini olakiniferum]
MKCRLGITTGAVNDYENMGTLKIPATLPIGSRLWTLQSYTRNLTFWTYQIVKPQGELSYFYPNPEGKVIGESIDIGIIYNSQDIGIITNGGTTASRVSTGSWINPGPSGSNLPVNPTMLNVTVQLYLEKKGNITNSTAGVDGLKVFQIDGEGGINNKPDSNYGLTLSGLHGIEVMKCSASITVSPDNYVDFGTIKSWTDASASVVDQSVFHINASTDGGEDCGKGFNLSALMG